MAEAHEDVAELPLDSVGVRLRRAREDAGLSRADIAAKTKIAERHLQSIEEGNYAALASRTYAVGFSRSYARTVGLDEFAIAQSVRRELGDLPSEDDRRSASTFEPGDPARVPTSRLAWISALVALAVLVGVWFVWRSYLAPGADLPDLTAPPEAAPAPATPAASQLPAAAPAALAPSPAVPSPAAREPVARAPVSRPRAERQPARPRPAAAAAVPSAQPPVANPPAAPAAAGGVAPSPATGQSLQTSTVSD